MILEYIDLSFGSLVGNALAAAVLIFIAYAVLTGNKAVASFSQLGDLQKRAAVNDEIQEHRKTVQEYKRRISFSSTSPKAGDADVSPVGVGFAQGASPVERLSFVVGVVNVCLTCYLLGSHPTKFYLWFTPKVIILTTLRWLDFVSKKTHWLLADFCYWANGLVVVYIWFMPHNAHLFKILFFCANGPLAWSVLTFNQALVFHKWQQVVSVFIHVEPMLLSYGLRWHYDPAFSVCDDYPACSGDSYQGMIWYTLIHFYLWWVALYYLVIFVALGSYLESRSFKTLFDRVAGSQMKFLFGKNAVFGSSHKLIQKAVYMLSHVVFSIFTMTVACMWWSHWWAHMTFILVICSASAYNASIHYDAQFKVDRELAASQAKKAS